MADKKEASGKEQENVKIITEQQLIINNQQAIYEILTELVKQVKALKPKPNH